MKYSETNKPIVCMQTNSSCYKNTTTMTPKGVLWHSTGANNPYISRYVQPMETDSDYKEMIALLGKNKYRNDWNHKARSAGLNCWIGKLADGSVATVQTMPWNYKPWGCGAGSKGSLNNTHMQFEICEDNLTDKKYFDAVYKEACEITAYYCKKYDLDPLGTIVYKGVTVPVITTHKESHDLKLGSNHGDPIKWLKKFGKDMDDVREDVAKLMGIRVDDVPIPLPLEPEKKPESTTTPAITSNFELGEEVKLVAGAKYSSGKSIPSWVFKKKLYVRKIKGDSITISTLKTGAVTGTVNAKNLVKVSGPVIKEPVKEPSKDTTLKVGDKVKLKAGAKYSSGKTIPSWVFKKTLYVRQIDGDKIRISTLKVGAITGTVLKDSLVKE